MNTEGIVKKAQELDDKLNKVKALQELHQLIEWMGNRYIPVILFQGNSNVAEFRTGYCNKFISDAIKEVYSREASKLEKEILEL